MKNIYDIFEQRKIDSINCDYKNILETYEEIDMLCNTLDNDYYDCIEEAFDFKKMKDNIKSGAKSAGKAIVNVIENLIDFLRELWKKIKGWFKKAKNFLLGKKDTKKIIEKKLEDALDDDEDVDPELVKRFNTKMEKGRQEAIEREKREMEDQNKVDFGEWVDQLANQIQELREKEKNVENAKEKEKIEQKIKEKQQKMIELKAKFAKKKIVSKAEQIYKQNKSEARKNNKDRIPSLKEVIFNSGDFKFKSTNIPNDREFAGRYGKLIDALDEYCNNLIDGADISETVLERIKKTLNLENPDMESIKKFLQGHDDTEEVMTLKSVGKDIISYIEGVNTMISIFDFAERKITKMIDETIKHLEKSIARDVRKNREDQNTELDRQALANIKQCSSTMMQVSQLALSVYNNEYNKASQIALKATDNYIKNVLKR